MVAAVLKAKIPDKAKSTLSELLPILFNKLSPSTFDLILGDFFLGVLVLEGFLI